jgi:dihydrofolate reductase
MYETMVYWETAPFDESVSVSLRDFTQMWRAAEKLVYSRTLQSASSARTRIETSFDAETIRLLKKTSGRDLTVGGTELAGQAIEAQLVDEVQLFVAPVVVGGGKSWLPKSVHLNLELLDSRVFGSGFVFLRYRPARAGEGSSP